MRRERYEVDIETFGPMPDDDTLEAFADAFETVGVRGAIGAAGALGGGIGASFAVEAGSPSDAVERAVLAFETACEKIGFTHGGIARVEVVTEPYFDRRLNLEPERYAGVSEVAALFGVSRQRVAELRTKQGFPAPVAELAAGPIWAVSSLNRFLERWERRPGRPRRARSA